MPIQTRYLFSAAMDVEPSKEALFNEVYDKEHVPLILTVPGVISAVRFKRQPVTLILGGEKKTIVMENEPRYDALYELDSPDVLLSPAWARPSTRVVGRETSAHTPRTAVTSSTSGSARSRIAMAATHRLDAEPGALRVEQRARRRCLEIDPGDTVVFDTRDAGRRLLLAHLHSRRRARRAVPSAATRSLGPCGCAARGPGDALVVEILEMEPARLRLDRDPPGPRPAPRGGLPEAFPADLGPRRRHATRAPGIAHRRAARSLSRA